MALRDLSNVTRTLKNLLILNIGSNLDTSLKDKLHVTPQSPDKINAAEFTISIYLYHIAEDPYYKNTLGTGNDIPNIAKAPMALSLFYILSTHHREGESMSDPEVEQKLMGYALKTFHDVPVITDATTVPVITDTGDVEDMSVIDTEIAGQDNVIQVILRPLTPEDTVSFWAAGDMQTARLSAYYEVRVIMLEPEKPKTFPGVVLNVGNFLHQLGTPHLDCSQNLVSFTLPQSSGGLTPPPAIKSTPARVTLNTSDPEENQNQMVLRGSNLTSGRSRSLVLKNSIWLRLTGGAGENFSVQEAEVDLALNPGWNVQFQSQQINVTLSSILNVGHVLPMLPGFYTASVRTLMEERFINNEVKRVTVTSNEVGFLIVPRIAGQTVTNGLIEIDIGTEFELSNNNLPQDAVQVIIDGVVFTQTNNNPPENTKEFFLARETNMIIARPDPDIIMAPGAHPFRLIVNGAESAPFWIEIN